jgi:hypothetical protein
MEIPSIVPSSAAAGPRARRDLPDFRALIKPGDLGLDPASVRQVETLWSTEGVPAEIAEILAPRLMGAVIPGDAAYGHGFRVSVAEARAGVGRVGGAGDGDAVAPLALTVVPQGEAPAGPRIESLLRDAVQRIARDEESDAVARIQAVAAALLPEGSEVFERLGQLRWSLLARVAVALDYAVCVGAPGAILLTHEVVSLRRTREARRRNNREDLDRFVRRLSGGAISQLARGVLAGPVRVGTVDLYLGKVRRDLP